jgi:hypothetical protein
MPQKGADFVVFLKVFKKIGIQKYFFAKAYKEGVKIETFAFLR